MPTNAQRFGTRNLPLNLPVEYITELGKAAFSLAKRSRTALVVELLEAGAALRDPKLAKRLVEIRRQFYAASLLLLFCLTLFSHDTRGGRRGHRPMVNKAHAVTRGKWEPLEV